MCNGPCVRVCGARHRRVETAPSSSDPCALWSRAREREDRYPLERPPGHAQESSRLGGELRRGSALLPQRMCRRRPHSAGVGAERGGCYRRIGGRGALRRRRLRRQRGGAVVDAGGRSATGAGEAGQPFVGALQCRSLLRPAPQPSSILAVCRGGNRRRLGMRTGPALAPLMLRARFVEGRSGRRRRRMQHIWPSDGGTLRSRRPSKRALGQISLGTTMRRTARHGTAWRPKSFAEFCGGMLSRLHHCYPDCTIAAR